ncbi:MAG TPA: hypothetical protein PLQ36_00300 [Candidatus Gracilibacteria bacterium]|nr:hypothetical protein [Candidatus Gracilibacteria bacterium]
MSHTWNNIDDQIHHSKEQINSVLKEKPSFKKHQNKILIGLSSLALIGFVFWGSNSNSFIASILNTPISQLNEENNLNATNPFGDQNGLEGTNGVEENDLEGVDLEENNETEGDKASDVDLEASDIDLSEEEIPVTIEDNSSDQVNETPTIDSDKTEDKASDEEVIAKTTSGLSMSDENQVNETPKSDNFVNPFDSIKTNSNNNSTNAITSDNDTNTASTNNNQLNNLPIASPLENTVTEEVSPFRENTHTYLENNNDEYLHGAAIEPISSPERPVIKANNPNLFTGTLLAANPEPRKSAFTFYLQLADGSKLKLNTARDLRNVIGKQISVEIKGNKERFSIEHVYYNKNKQKAPLAQTGPEALLLLSGLGAGLLALKRRFI